VEASLLGGFFAAGASNHGFALTGTGGLAFPVEGLGVVPLSAFATELSLGLRTATLARVDPAIGSLASGVVGMPIDIGGRGRVGSWGHVRLDVGAVAGVMPFWNHLTSSAFRFSQAGTGFNVGGYVQGAYAWSHFELVLEARGEYAPANTTLFKAQLGGFLLTAGGRFGS
jgi:hypothetical protein